MLQELESEFRVSRRGLLHMELAAFIGLEFSVLPPASEITPHYTHIQKSVGLVTSSRHLSADSGCSEQMRENRFHRMSSTAVVE
ncbi:unnamed protein product [Mesocestoides corti]|uniref:Cyclin N-terminal domain-containing protein n=2 Tax=Mesocestoides corti TaxID=53468 RepID=A0A0R3U745_MESCO|nr:unnamed protein product [Mesocestoides corti]